MSKTEALEVSPQPVIAPESTAKVRFVKTMSPDDPVVLGPDLPTVVFHVPVNNLTGDRCSYGWFETDDAIIIEALRKVKVERPYLYVFEQ